MDLIKYIFTIPGVKSFLSEQISQDPLEKYFGRQRQRGGVNENPTCQEFLQNNNALRMVNSITIETHKGNVRDNDCSMALPKISAEPLPKRRKQEAEQKSQSQKSQEELTLQSDIFQHGIISTIINYVINIIGLLVEAKEDEGFNVSSPEATAAKNAALGLMNWTTSDQSENMNKYNTYLLQLFNIWISVPPTTSKICEEIWRRFSLFTSSSHYTSFWSSLYNEARVKGSPVLSFYLTYTYFICHWKIIHPTKSTLPINTSSETSHLSYDEENVLWYIGGYFIRKIKIKCMVKARSDDLLVILNSFVEDEDNATKSQDDENMTAKKSGLLQSTMVA